MTASVSLEFATAEQVDEVFARATKLGASGEVTPTHSFWGTRTAILRDVRSSLDHERAAEPEESGKPGAGGLTCRREKTG